MIVGASKILIDKKGKYRIPLPKPLVHQFYLDNKDKLEVKISNNRIILEKI